MNKHLIMAANSKGFVVKYCEPTQATIFGDAELIIIEGSTHRITFVSNALHGRNYFKIKQVEDLINRRTYIAQRYHHKFIGLIQGINSDTFLRVKAENKVTQELKDEGIL